MENIFEILRNEIKRQYKETLRQYKEQGLYNGSFILGFRQACQQISDHIDKLERGE